MPESKIKSKYTLTFTVLFLSIIMATDNLIVSNVFVLIAKVIFVVIMFLYACGYGVVADMIRKDPRETINKINSAPKQNTINVGILLLSDTILVISNEYVLATTLSFNIIIALCLFAAAEKMQTRR